MAELCTDNQCIQVDPVSWSYPRNVNATVTYTCTSLLSGFSSIFSYCPVRTCQTDYHWTNSSLSCGVNECYTAGQSAQYTGRRMCTVSGRTCQPWVDQSPHAHPYNTLASFPDTSAAALGSHCRDPGDKGQPWCYTTDPGVEWEFCGLPECSTLLVTSGTCLSTTTSSSGSTVLTPTPMTTASTPSPVTDSLYQRVSGNRVGVQFQTALSNIRSATSCCRRCYQMTSCIMVVYEVVSEACTLYREDAESVSPVDCSSQKCFVLQSHVTG
ncbi:plasminogen-like [Dreissena polymorpha]|uniref:plasminogen-like n=1 Tax=Dreissena polymorpha TaxID=45954 RepID=UPI002263E347|nr:plasminogen-like [Dreissena polymorpha]